MNSVATVDVIYYDSLKNSLTIFIYIHIIEH